MEIEKYQELVRRANKSRKERDQAVGALKQLKQELKTKFECDSINQAEKLLEKLDSEIQAKQKQFENKLKSFEREFNEQNN